MDIFEKLFDLINNCPAMRFWQKKELYKCLENWAILNLGIKINMNDYVYDEYNYDKYIVMDDVTKKVFERKQTINDFNLEPLEAFLNELDRNDEDACYQIQEFLKEYYGITGVDLSPKYCNNEIIDNVIMIIKEGSNDV